VDIPGPCLHGRTAADVFTVAHPIAMGEALLGTWYGDACLTHLEEDGATRPAPAAPDCERWVELGDERAVPPVDLASGTCARVVMH
jgi:hypothetical protein